MKTDYEIYQDLKKALRPQHSQTDVGADIWDKEVESEIDHLTSEWEEYYPFTIKHIKEAITQQSDGDWMIFAMYAIPANNPILYELAHKNISDTCAKYWRDVARKQAEKNVNMRTK